MTTVSALRNILARKSIRVFLIAAMAVPGWLLVASPAASARTGLQIKETFGSYYIGAPTVALDDPVVETTGSRSFNILSAGGGEEFQFVANTSLCVAAANNGVDVVMHPCNGGSGVIWHEVQGKSSTLFENNKFAGKYLSGDNKGNQYQLKSKGASGWDQQFTVGA